MEKNSWDLSENWYTQCVGEKGHYYHQAIVIPNLLRLLAPSKSLLDLGCGTGVLARHLPKDLEYLGVDSSKKLIEQAERKTKEAKFFVADLTAPVDLPKSDFDYACFVLSLQNMPHPEIAIANASRHMKKGGLLCIVLNHPCFRIPRQSSWGIDEKMKLQYRRMNVYMSPQTIPIQTAPSKGEQSEITNSYHHNLSDYARFLQNGKFVITQMEEWCSDKKSTGPKAKMEDRARREFPLFLAILARKTK